MIIAPVLGDNLPTFGRKRAIRFGSILMTVATLMFASGALCSNAVTFYIVSFVARALQGAADALILVSVPSIIAIEWPE